MNITDLQIGDKIGGRFCLEGQIGEGGMASVWRATDETLNRPVAVKFLYIRDIRQQDTMIRAFLREARIAAAVRHRNVVDILDFGTHNDDLPFMVMELLEGETVEDRLFRGERFTIEETLSIGARTLQGLVAVHDAGIVHRDLKPANIFLIRDRVGFYPKLLDFGISRSLEPSTGRESALTTQDGRIVGTLEYMSSEQARGQTDIDKRTDIYSVGIILYELITGRLPFESEHQGDLIVQIMTSIPPTVYELNPEVGKPLSDLIEKAMQRDREHRFADAEDMHDALIHIAEEDIGMQFAQAMSVAPPRPLFRTPARTQKLVFSKAPKEATSDQSVLKVHPKASIPTPLAEETRVKGKLFKIWAMMGAAVLLLSAIAIGYSLLLPAPSSNANATRYIVVKGTNDSRPEQLPETNSPDVPKESTKPTPTPPPMVESKYEPTQKMKKKVGIVPKIKKVTSTKKSIPARTQAQQLAQTFSAQKASVTKCFSDYETEADQASHLSIRLHLGINGQVLKVQVLPKGIANTAIGKCIGAATLRMKFGPQKEPISFRVPLTARFGR